MNRRIGYQHHRRSAEFGDTLCTKCLTASGISPTDPVCPWSLLRPEEMSEGAVYCVDCGESLEPTPRDL